MRSAIRLAIRSGSIAEAKAIIEKRGSSTNAKRWGGRARRRRAGAAPRRGVARAIARRRSPLAGLIAPAPWRPAQHQMSQIRHSIVNGARDVARTTAGVAAGDALLHRFGHLHRRPAGERSMSEFKSDIEIARAARLLPIGEVAARLGIPADALCQYGSDKAKVRFDFLEQLARPAGRQARAGHRDHADAGGRGQDHDHGRPRRRRSTASASAPTICLREPSLGPCFGMKGGAAGGGYAQVVPMEDINLHFTGDFHAIGTAHNLLAALLDNHLYWGNELGLDARRITWRRVHGHERPRAAPDRRARSAASPTASRARTASTSRSPPRSWRSSASPATSTTSSSASATSSSARPASAAR